MLNVALATVGIEGDYVQVFDSSSSSGGLYRENSMQADFWYIDGALYTCAGYHSTASQRMFYRSEDNGTTWSACSSAITFDSSSWNPKTRGMHFDIVYDGSTYWYMGLLYSASDGHGYSRFVTASRFGDVVVLASPNPLNLTDWGASGNNGFSAICMLNGLPVFVVSTYETSVDEKTSVYFATTTTPTSIDDFVQVNQTDFASFNSVGMVMGDIAPYNSTHVLLTMWRTDQDGDVYGAFVSTSGFGAPFVITSNDVEGGSNHDANSYETLACAIWDESKDDPNEFAEHLLLAYQSNKNVYAEIYNIAEDQLYNTTLIYNGTATSYYPRWLGIGHDQTSFFICFQKMTNATFYQYEMYETDFLSDPVGYTVCDNNVLHKWGSTDYEPIAISTKTHDGKFWCSFEAYSVNNDVYIFSIEAEGIAEPEEPEEPETDEADYSWLMIGIAGIALCFISVCVPAYIYTEEGLFELKTLKAFGFGVIGLLFGYALIIIWLRGGFIL